MTTLFFSYSHADEDLRDTLEKHLAAMKHQGLIETWHDRCILAGDAFDREIAQNLEEADIILLLVSADFIASKYCYDIEMKRAMERHHAGEARVVPVILRACDWHDTPFGTLLAVPKDGKPVRSWPDLDDAFHDVVKRLKKIIKEQRGPVDTPKKPPAARPISAARPQAGSRSSNLRTRKQFSEAVQDAFLEEAFTFMANYFENSLHELEARNADITTRFRRIDANKFTAVIYRDGNAISRCKVLLGGMFGRGISYSSSDQADDNSCNENLSVEHDDQNLYLKPMGMAFHHQLGETHLTYEGAAEYYWSMLMNPIQ